MDSIRIDRKAKIFPHHEYCNKSDERCKYLYAGIQCIEFETCLDFHNGTETSFKCNECKKLYEKEIIQRMKYRKKPVVIEAGKESIFLKTYEPIEE